MLFYGGSKTHSILWRFQNPRYFTEVSKFMVINRGFKPTKLNWGFKTYVKYKRIKNLRYWLVLPGVRKNPG